MDKNMIWKFLADEVSSEDAEKLMQWVSQSDENQKLFSEIKLLWMASHSIKDEITLKQKSDFESVILQIENQKQNKPEKFYLSRYLGSNKPIWNNLLKVAAAVLLIYSITASLIFISKSKENIYTEVSTRRGKQSEVMLADGTHIWLNSESSIKYPVNVHSNEVNIYLKGEAYFDVQKNKARKFIVNAGELKIAVLGTSFNVKSYDDEETIETTLEEGKISISGKIAEKQISNPIILEPNQRIIFNKKRDAYHLTQVNSSIERDISEDSIASNIELTVNAETELYTSWKDGVLLFKNERFEDLSEKMERWFNVQIIIEYEALKDTRYTGVFENESIETALKALCLSLPFEYEIREDKVTIREKKGKDFN